MAAKKKTPAKTQKKIAKSSAPKALRPQKSAASVKDVAKDEEPVEKKVYSKEEQEILKRKRRSLDDEEAVDLPKRKKKLFPEDDEVLNEPRVLDGDEYFYEESAAEDKFM